jgi:hypothetical protein
MADAARDAARDADRFDGWARPILADADLPAVQRCGGSGAVPVGPLDQFGMGDWTECPGCEDCAGTR